MDKVVREWPKGIHRVVTRGVARYYYRPKRGSAQGPSMSVRITGEPGQPRFEAQIARYAKNEVYVPPGLRDFFIGRLQHCRARSAKTRRPYDLTIEFILDMYERQQGRCAVSGLQFQQPLSEEFDEAWAPSIDRINSSKGYTMDNVRLVVRIANFAMGPWGDKALLKLAKAVVRKSQSDWWKE